jgi:hypothetical protein
MSPKMPRPAAPGRAHRAANSKELACTFNCQDREDKHQAGPVFNRPAASVRGAEWLASAISDRLDLAFALGGPLAFECPKTSAAFHEAGHCVFDTVLGERPSKASIWPIVELGREQWIGPTYGSPRWRVDARTPPKADLQHARSQLAGVVSEMLFDSDFRLGSSVDEIAIAEGIVLTAAAKLRRDVQQLWLETLVSVATTLRANEGVVRHIAAELINRRSVKASRLAYLLRSIGGPALGRRNEP